MGPHGCSNINTAHMAFSGHESNNPFDIQTRQTAELYVWGPGRFRERPTLPSVQKNTDLLTQSRTHQPRANVPSIRSDHQQRDQTKKGAQAAMTSHASDSSPGVIPREHTKGPAASLPPFKSCPAPTFPPPAASLLFPPLPKVSVQILTSTTGSQQQP